MRYAILLTSICLAPAFDIAAQTEKSATDESAKAIYRDEISGFDAGDANALDVVKLLNDQFPNLKFSAEPTTNRIYCRVPESLIDDIDEFIHELANIAADHRHRQEKMRQLQLDKEAERREREEQLRQERAAKERADLEARYGPLAKDRLNSGITLSMPLGLRIAQTQQRHAELQLQKLFTIYGPNHPEVRDAELQIEAIKHLQKPQFHLFDQHRVEGFAKNESHPLIEQPAKLAEVLKQLRPDLDVKIEGTDNGQLIFSGSETSVAEAQRVIKALQDVTVGTNPATLQGQYEDAERSAAQFADQLREANSAMAPDRKRIAELRAHLTNSVQLAFELRLQLQQYQLERAEADLMTARARLIRREQIAEQIIERRISELENQDDLAWAPATHRKTKDERENAGARKLEDSETLQRGMNQVQGQFDEAKASWTAERKKYRVDQEQLIQQVNDLREKLKAATRVGFDKPRQSGTTDENRQRSALDERKIAPTLEPIETAQSATTQSVPDVSEWESSFGIRFGDVVDLRETNSSFRGGIRIASVHEDTLASHAGIQAGDLLVGIHIWETVSLENLNFVTKQIKSLPDKNGLKFYIVRKGETIFGTLATSRLPTTSNPTPASSTNFEQPNVQPTKTRF